MLLLCLCTLTGAYSLTAIPQLPSTSVVQIAMVVAMACLAVRRLHPPAFFLIGFTVMGIAAMAHRADQLDVGFQGRSLSFSAEIEGFPTADAASTRFLVRPVDRKDLPRRIRLTWNDAETIPSIGETWRLHVRLKRPRGFANPGGFDFEGWLFRQRIGATGYVEGNNRNYRIHGERPDLIDRMRARFVARVASGLPQDDASAVLMAIGVGARHRIDRSQWDLYARTGTSHLMAISGLHIGLAAGGTFFLCWVVLAPFCTRRNIRDIAVSGAMLAALVYTTMSGFAVPARRALLMTIFAGLVLLLRRRLRPELLLVIPCLVVFVSEPLTILAPGFKLSFAAVAILFLVARQHFRFVPMKCCPGAAMTVTAIARLADLQLALLAGLFPLTVLIFDRFAAIAPAVNMLVLPIFNFITVPLTLMGAALDGPVEATGSHLLRLAHVSIGGILWLVAIAGELESASYQTRHLGFVFALVATIPLLFVLLPPAWPGRKLAVIAIVATLIYRPSQPPPRCFDYHILDVGQGLAVVLQTHRHALVFDTGPSFPNGSNTAELVVLPFLHGRGIDRLDKLIISHGDLDHAGGANSVITAFNDADMLVGEPLPDVDRNQRRCVAGDRWQWNSIEFAFLHPRENVTWDRNNSSCVLLVKAGHFSLLLTGDLESPAEKLLLHRRLIPAADIVVVPHHGSGTSSSLPFVDATGPVLAVVSSGFRNRWSFPKHEVVTRWEASGSNVLNTATMGAVSQRICHDTGLESVRLQRLASQKYWHEGPSGRR